MMIIMTEDTGNPEVEAQGGLAVKEEDPTLVPEADLGLMTERGALHPEDQDPIADLYQSPQREESPTSAARVRALLALIDSPDVHTFSVQEQSTSSETKEKKNNIWISVLAFEHHFEAFLW